MLLCLLLGDRCGSSPEVHNSGRLTCSYSLTRTSRGDRPTSLNQSWLGDKLGLLLMLNMTTTTRGTHVCENSSGCSRGRVDRSGDGAIVGVGLLLLTSARHRSQARYNPLLITTMLSGLTRLLLLLLLLTLLDHGGGSSRQSADTHCVRSNNKLRLLLLLIIG